MQKVDLGQLKVWLADESWKVERDKFFARHMEVVMEMFLKRRLFRELIELHARQHGLRGHAILKAHRVPDRSGKMRYLYRGDGRNRLVQNWINEVDGKFAVIFLQVCGTKRAFVTSRRSIVIHPTIPVNLVKLIRSQARLRLYLPGTGYLGDNQYYLRKAVDELRGTTS